MASASRASALRARLSSVSKKLSPSRRSTSNCDMFFTKSHEWVQLRSADSNVARIGLSDFRALTSGDYLTIALDQIDIAEDVYRGQELCQVDTTTDLLESVTVPISGKVTKVNCILKDLCEIAHRSPEDDGWLAEIEIANLKDLDRLMTKEEYNSYLEQTGKMELLK